MKRCIAQLWEGMGTMHVHVLLRDMWKLRIASSSWLSTSNIFATQALSSVSLCTKAVLAAASAPCTSEPQRRPPSRTMVPWPGIKATKEREGVGSVIQERRMKGHLAWKNKRKKSTVCCTAKKCQENIIDVMVVWDPASFQCRPLCGRNSVHHPSLCLQAKLGDRSDDVKELRITPLHFNHVWYTFLRWALFSNYLSLNSSWELCTYGRESNDN